MRRAHSPRSILLWIGSLLTLGLSGCASSSAPAAQDRELLGPVLGAPEPNAIRVWMRVPPSAGGEFAVIVRGDRGELSRGPWIATDPQADDTAVALVAGLRPGTEYRYRVRLRAQAEADQESDVWYRARTAPAPGEPAKLRLAFGSCANRPGDQPVWDVMARQRPDLFVSLGDIPYADTRDPELLMARQRESRSDPRFLALAREVPVVAIWDDHDFGGNDKDGLHPGKQAALQAFRAYWPNPGSGDPTAVLPPGVWTTMVWGRVQLFLLDDQSFRNVPRRGLDLLGAEQRRFLERELLGSQAAIKLLASGSPWHDRPVGTRFLGLFPQIRKDAWWAYADRAWLFDLLTQRSISGVVLLSGDLHRHELHQLRWAGAYPLFELVSSPLRQNLRPCVRSAATRLWCDAVEGFALLETDGGPVDYSYWSSDGRRILGGRPPIVPFPAEPPR